jgi:hypothetical protein
MVCPVLNPNLVILPKSCSRFWSIRMRHHPIWQRLLLTVTPTQAAPADAVFGSMLLLPGIWLCGHGSLQARGAHVPVHHVPQLRGLLHGESQGLHSCDVGSLPWSEVALSERTNWGVFQWNCSVVSLQLLAQDDWYVITSPSVHCVI